MAGVSFHAQQWSYIMGRHADQIIENAEEAHLEYLTKKYLPDTLDLILDAVEEDLEDYLDKWRDFQSASGQGHATLRDMAEHLTREKAESGDYDYLEDEDPSVECSCDDGHFEEGGRVEPCTCFDHLAPEPEGADETEPTQLTSTEIINLI